MSCWHSLEKTRNIWLTTEKNRDMKNLSNFSPSHIWYEVISLRAGGALIETEAWPSQKMFDPLDIPNFGVTRAPSDKLCSIKKRRRDTHSSIILTSTTDLDYKTVLLKRLLWQFITLETWIVIKQRNQTQIMYWL